MKKKEVPAKKSDRPTTIYNELDSKLRAKGVKLAKDDTVVFVKNSEQPLPTNLVPYLTKIAAKGKDGVRVKALLPEDEGQAKYAHWLIKQLVPRKLIKVVAEPKKEAK